MRAAAAAVAPDARPRSGLQRPGPAAARVVLPPAVHTRRRGRPTHAASSPDGEASESYQCIHAAYSAVAFSDHCQQSVTSHGLFAGGVQLLAPILRGAAANSGGQPPNQQLLYDAGVAAWELTYHPPAAQQMQQARGSRDSFSI